MWMAISRITYGEDSHKELEPIDWSSDIEWSNLFVWSTHSRGQMYDIFSGNTVFDSIFTLNSTFSRHFKHADDENTRKALICAYWDQRYLMGLDEPDEYGELEDAPLPNDYFIRP